MIGNAQVTVSEPNTDEPEQTSEVSVLSTTGLLGPAEVASVQPARLRHHLTRPAATVDEGVRWQHDLATEPALTVAQAALLLGLDDDQASRILGWLRSRGMLVAVRQPDGFAYPRFQFDPAGSCVHRVVALVNVWLGAGRDPYTVAGWWLRRRGDGRRACDLVGTLDEDLVLEFAAADIDRQVLTFGVQPEPPPRPTVAGSSGPTLFFDDGEFTALPPTTPPAARGIRWRRRGTDRGTAPATTAARRRGGRLRHMRRHQTPRPGDHPATTPSPAQPGPGLELGGPFG